MNYTFYGDGSGYPIEGDLVILDCGHGEYELKCVKECGPIQTKQWSPNWVELTLEDSVIDWDDLTPEQQEIYQEELRRLS